MKDDAITIRPDPKGRVSVGKLMPEGVTSFRAWRDKDQRIILEPCIDIPVREAWLFRNKQALGQVRRGLQDSAAGKTVKKGNFAAYADDNE